VPFIGPQIDHNRIAELHKQYQEALQRKDYEEARRLFDEIIKELGKGVIRGPGAKIAAFFGSIFLTQQPTIHTLIGGILILSAGYVVASK